MNSQTGWLLTLLNFSNIAAPLYLFTPNNVPFSWDEACNKAFRTLQAQLIQAPVLAYPCFDPDADEFVLQTDASAVDLGAIWNSLVRL